MKIPKIRLLAFFEKLFSITTPQTGILAHFHGKPLPQHHCPKVDATRPDATLRPLIFGSPGARIGFVVCCVSQFILKKYIKPLILAMNTFPMLPPYVSYQGQRWLTTLNGRMKRWQMYVYLIHLLQNDTQIYTVQLLNIYILPPNWPQIVSVLLISFHWDFRWQILKSFSFVKWREMSSLPYELSSEALMPYKSVGPVGDKYPMVTWPLRARVSNPVICVLTSGSALHRGK